jgi:hypothetical protein
LGKVVFPDGVLQKFENTIIDYLVGGGISLRAAGDQRFKKRVVSLTNGYEPPSTRTILRRTVEQFRIADPLLSSFLRQLDVAISLTLDGWSNRNLKGFYVVTVHWIDVSSMTMKSLLLTIIDVTCGTGVGRRVGTALFEHLKGMGLDVLTRLLNVVSDNGADATAAVKQLFQLVNGAVGYEQMLPSNHVRCFDHSVQLGVVKVLALIQKINEQLRQALVSIRRSKVIQPEYHRAAEVAGLSSKEPTHLDTPTRWNSTHEMGVSASAKRFALESIMEQFKDCIGCGALFDAQWQGIGVVSTFLRTPRQLMESLAADHCLAPARRRDMGKGDREEQGELRLYNGEGCRDRNCGEGWTRLL